MRQSGPRLSGLDCRSPTLQWANLALLIATSILAPGLAFASVGPHDEQRAWRAQLPAIEVAQARTGPLVSPVRPDLDSHRELPVPGALPRGVEQPGIIRKIIPRSPAAAPQPAPAPAPGTTATPPADDAKSRPGARSLPLGDAERPEKKLGPAPIVGGQPRMIVRDPQLKGIVDDFGPEAIITPDTPGEAAEPVDSREAVSAIDLDNLPFSAIGKLTTVHAGGARLSGTGFMIGPGLVLTAAHVLDDYQHGPALQVSFEPGCAAGARHRFEATVQTVQQDRYRIAPGWRAATYPLRYDFAVIALPPANWHQHCGWLPVRPIERSFLDRHVRLETRRFVLAGFPSDRSEGGQWVGRGRLSRDGGFMVEHKIDTETGQSGAPVIAVLREAKSPGGKIAVPIAIHSRMGAALAANYNSARVMDRELVDRIRQLAADLGVEF